MPAQIKSVESNSPAVRLVQITDSHNFSNLDTPIRGINPHHSFLDVLYCAQAFIQAADAIMLTGDLAHDEHEQTYKNLRALMETHNKPVWSLPGNHDNPMEMSHLLSGDDFHYLGHQQIAGWEIISLDSHCPHQASGLLGASELQRLTDRFEHSEADFFLIALHHHVLPVGSAWLDGVSLQDATEFLETISQEPRIKGVCSGHVHQSYDKTVGSVRFLTCPSTCTQFAPLKADFMLDTKPPGFRWIHLYQDGTIQSQVAWLNSTPWD